MRIFAIGLIAFTAGCSQSVSLFPVEGPLADHGGVSEIVGTAHDVHKNTGALEVTLPSGSTCSGKWSSLAPQMTTTTTTSLLTTYGSALGISTASGPLPGINRGEAIAICQDGRRIDMEFLTGSGTANGVGVAKDTEGNVYKMLF